MEDEWASILNPDVIRTRFLRAGLFLDAHEMLVAVIKDRLHDFFSDTWTPGSGWNTSAAYRENVLLLDPKGKNDPFRSSVAWLIGMKAIDGDDERAIREFTEKRNTIAHELRGLVGGSHQLDFDDVFQKILEMVAKIEKWWIVNIEIATDPEFYDKEIKADSVVPGSLLLLQILKDVALGEDDETWAIYREFLANAKA
ncbi:MAG: hypothetical protein QM627_07350 [Luteolibacter sp.]